MHASASHGKAAIFEVLSAVLSEFVLLPPEVKKMPRKQKQPNSKRRTRQGARARADRQLAQGVGKSVRKAFGASTGRYSLKCWDAFSPLHLPLPRAVGPYTVVRTTRIIESDSRVMIFGTMNEHETGRWSNAICLASNDANLSVSNPNNTRLFTVPLPSVGSGTFVPAALSVQVLNPNALQSTSGIVAGAVCPTQLALHGQTYSWNTLNGQLFSYMRPRLMSAGKLALRGVQGDAYPLNMSALASFEPLPTYAAVNDSVVTYTNAALPVEFQGMSPIVILNDNPVPNPPPEDPGRSTLSLQYLVTVEWRVRFDITNPAVASHQQHPTASDQTWDSLIKQAVDRGNGMLDIVERVANVGSAVAPYFKAAPPVAA